MSDRPPMTADETAAYEELCATLNKGVRHVVKMMIDADRRFGYVTLDTDEDRDGGMVMVCFDPYLTKRLASLLTQRFGGTLNTINLEDDDAP